MQKIHIRIVKGYFWNASMKGVVQAKGAVMYSHDRYIDREREYSIFPYK